MLLQRNKAIQSLELPLHAIKPNPNQPRKNFDQESLMELALSIKSFGVLQPVLVNRMDNGSYLLIAGERRFRAAQLAGQKKIPAIVKNFSEQDIAVIALTENLQRENLTYFEEALAYATLVKEYHLTQMDISKLVGKQQSTISNKMRLLSLSDEIKALLIKHNLTERHARALLSIEDNPGRMEVLQLIIAQDLNIAQTEKLIASISEERMQRELKKNRPKFINYKIYINTLKKAFRTIQEVSGSAEFSQEDKGDFVEVKILIPKTEPFDQNAV